MDETARKIREGDVRALARTATGVESGDPAALEVLRGLRELEGHAVVLGVTGSPGAGKSTLVDAMASALRRRGKTVAILAVDPSSRITGGAVLGDRIRMQQHHADPGVFIRSMATRGTSGGLARATADLARLMDAAGKDYVIIETVGVGQDEIDIASLAHVVVVVLTPGMGDDVQAIKAGILEIAGVFAVNKADQPGADRVERELKAEGWKAPVVLTVATAGKGVEKLLETVEQIVGGQSPGSAAGSQARPPAVSTGFGERDVEVARRPGGLPYIEHHHSGGNALKAEIGVIGGSGLYAMPGFTAQQEEHIETPFGSPSDNYVIGELCGRKIAFLARHGRGHRISPSELNFRANIYGMKLLGVERIISLSAVGSLKEEHRPLDFVIPDQFFDRTRGRASTFFGDGIVAHIGFSHPICPQLAEVMAQACGSAGVRVKNGGVYLCMEGPAFSTLAESNLYRSWGMDVIGMTNLQEAKLAREAEICYVTVAMVTDYDCWHPEHDAVTVAQIIDNLTHNAENACKVVATAIAAMPADRKCKCGSALSHAIITDRKLAPESTRRKLGILIEKYFV